MSRTPKPTRVAQVITRMIVGGAQETVLLTAALADRTRIQPVIVTGPQAGPEGSLLPQARELGMQVVVVPELVREVNPRADLLVVPALTRLFRDLDLSVVHTHSSKAGIVGRVAARRAGVPRVMHTVHGWPFHDHQQAVIASVWRMLERRAARLADTLVVVADADRKKGLDAGIGMPEQYVTIRSGVQLEIYGRDEQVRAAVRQELGLPTDSVVIGAVNRLSPQKDPASLVRAAAPVLRAQPETRLLLVGDGPLRREVSALVAELGVQPQVVMPGLRQDVPRLLSAMDVFVSASLWEGLPRTLLQAVATGLPLVVTAADGVLDLVENGRTGLLVPPGDASALTDAILACLHDQPAAAERAARAAQRLPAFDARRMVRELEALYLAPML